MTCRDVRPGLHRDGIALSDAERLVLEEHLQSCGGCRRDRDLLLRARELARELPLVPLATSAHQRAISRALLAGTALPRPERPPWRVLVPALVIAAAAVVALAIGLKQSDEAERPLVQASRPPEVGVVSGTLAGAAANGALPADVVVRAETDAVVRAPGARIAIARASELAWTADGVRLVRGMVDVEVDPTVGKRLRVMTARFVVEVTGTQFRVTPESVAVSRGSVRITGSDGTLLVERLSAGEQWTVPEPAASIDVVVPPSGPQISADTHLARARRAFATTNCNATEHHADAALDASPARTQTAEARLLLAECAQLRGRLDDAAARYTAITTRFGDLPAGETAWIALARLELKRGRTAEARRAFERYLQHHPAGRFATDAKRYLAKP